MRINENNTTIEISISNTTTQPVEIIGFTSRNFFGMQKKQLRITEEKRNQEDDLNGSIQIYGQGNDLNSQNLIKFSLSKKNI